MIKAKVKVSKQIEDFVICANLSPVDLTGRFEVQMSKVNSRPGLSNPTADILNDYWACGLLAIEAKANMYYECR